MNLAAGLKRLMLGPEEREIPPLKRNDRCWCNSGKKYKACHMADDDRKRSAQLAAAATQSAGSLKRGF
jgi:methionyl aminopeptidase